MTGSIVYFAPGPADHAPLREMARQAFAETFGHLYDVEPFGRFLDQAYGVGGGMAHDLADPGIQWQAAASGDRVIGYAKLSLLKAPAPSPRPGAMELQQIYVLKPWHGCGIAEHLMLWALDAARLRHAPEIYLTVFDHNERAKRFYTRHGFAEVGRCTFTLGDRVDDDRVWRRAL